MITRTIAWLTRLALRYPVRLLVGTLLVSLPAVFQVAQIRLDTDLARLLPKDSRAVRASRALERAVGGDGGYFSVVFEGHDSQALARASDALARQAAQLPDVLAVEQRNPVEFLRRYRYLLVPSPSLAEAVAYVDELEAEANPLLVDLGDGSGAGGGAPESSTKREELEARLQRYLDLPERNQSPDGRLMGVIVRSKRGVISLGATRALFQRLTGLAQETARAEGVTAWVSGSNRNKVDNYDQIRSDLNRSGTLAGLGILTVLVVAYRSLRILPIVLLPLGFGLLWSYALIPTLVGDLNTITSFLLMVLFGTGVEFAVHLVMRFQAELAEADLEQALGETFRSTGRSIVTSGLATTFGMAVLYFSRFRGFSEFGLISGLAILAIFAAMFVALPPLLVLGARFGLVRPRREGDGHLGFVPTPAVTILVLVLALSAGVLASFRLGFDYDFTRLQPEIPAAEEAKSRHRAVYPGYTVPGAFFVADDLEAVDDLVAALERRKAESGPSTALGSVSSVRDFVPTPAEFAERRRLVRELQERLAARWTERIQDEKQRRFIRQVREFVAPEAPPSIAELPPEIARRFLAKDGSGRLVVAVDVAGRSRDGRTAMAFTREVYGLTLPPGVQGPTGDKPVLAEILWLVTEEGPWLVGLTFLGIVLIVLVDRRSFVQAGWVLAPLVAGLCLTLGGMVVFGWRLNFFNIVVLPNLIGNAVDNGVHYYRRWRETRRDTAATQRELAEALTASALTTMAGYGGLVAAHHAGLRAIGSLAVWGLACCWFTGVVLMPGLLGLLARTRHGAEASDGT